MTDKKNFVDPMEAVGRIPLEVRDNIRKIMMELSNKTVEEALLEYSDLSFDTDSKDVDILTIKTDLSTRETLVYINDKPVGRLTKLKLSADIEDTHCKLSVSRMVNKEESKGYIPGRGEFIIANLETMVMRELKEFLEETD